MYSICMIARRPFDEFSPDIYKSLRDRHDKDCKICFITCDAKESAVIRAQFDETDSYEIEELSAFMNAHWDEFTLEKLVEYEKKYDAAPMWQYIYTDRFLIYRDRDYCIHTAAGLFAFFEYVFEKHQVQFYYDEAISTLLTFAAYKVGKVTNTRYFSQLLVRGGGMELKYHYILNEPMQHNALFDENYKNKTYSDEQKAAAEAFLKKFEETKGRPEHMKIAGKEPKLKLSDLKWIPFYFRQRYFNPYANDKGSYYYYKAYEHVLDIFRFYFRYRRCRKYYEHGALDKKYVYFPLHFQPEASTIVCAPKFEKQLFFLDGLAKSLPADNLLYVKEHYAGLGSREESFYQELKKYPNIVCVDPFEDSRTLIEHSQCVATLTGTAGFEAMLLRKPVIMGGDIFYYNAPGIMRVDDIFGKYIELMEAYQQPSREDLIQYLCEYLESAFEGNTYGSDPHKLEQSNIDLVADSVFNYMEMTNE